MVDGVKYSDQENFDFVQNLFEQIEPEGASPELKTRILSSVPTKNVQGTGHVKGAGWVDGLDELIEYLWPFGPVWRPAAGLAVAAVFGVLVGLTDPLSAASQVTQEEALTEEIVAFAVAIDGQFEDLP